jgi:glycosyltransferase involved in cell wall biosynthesis
MKKTALIPAYCPDVTMIDVMIALKAESFEIVVVDDGSPASCQAVFDQAEQYGTVIHQVPNQGKGAALKYGMHWIAEHGEDTDVVVTVDADGQHKAKDASALCEYAYAHPDTLVLGKRTFSGEKVPARSRMGNNLTAKAFRALTGVRVDDTQTGLRAFHVSLMPELWKAEGNRYEYEMEMLLTCVDEGIAIHEVPIETVYEPGNPTSHFHVIRDSILIYKDLFKFAFSSFSSFLIDYGLFSLFTLFFGTSYVLAANITARLISATANYELNRRYVFKDKGSKAASAAKYALLASVILALNTLLLRLLISLGMNAFFAKIIVELALFFFSWSMQKMFVFAKGTSESVQRSTVLK